ncbi:MAG: hypothetical protein CMI56_00080 [Parcubacteria group bacterium]|nr:hypothetical protein [Parcubacteria group bacterium]|tara:strand:- start:2309 stop:2839 length:531 start_codon:yes stop_codon:yes gene_type:complete
MDQHVSQDILVAIIRQSKVPLTTRLINREFRHLSEQALSNDWDSFMVDTLFKYWKNIKCPFVVGENIYYRGFGYQILDIKGFGINLYTPGKLYHYFTIPWKLLLMENSNIVLLKRCICFDVLFSEEFSTIRNYLGKDLVKEELQRNMNTIRFEKVLQHASFYYKLQALNFDDMNIT